MAAFLADSVDAVVIGGGPAGAAVGRLLADWGHSVRILHRDTAAGHRLAESIPPSTRKLLDTVGVLAAVERAAFYRSRGNTVWWGSSEPRIETFAPSSDHRAALGYQVYRPDFDRVLRRCAADAGAIVRDDALVRSVRLSDDGASVDYDEGDEHRTVHARFVLDASGRTGIVGRRFRRPQSAHRTCALVGAWRADVWDVPDSTHTVVEAHAGGWAWSVPVSPTLRHVGVMIERAAPESTGQALGDRYRAELAKLRETGRMLDRAALDDVWACDASLYCAEQYAGPSFVLVGDAGSFIDPLSSYGVKKALASAWIAAIAVHTSLVDEHRRSAALDFFSDWERDVYATHLRRSREFARAAVDRSANGFWSGRADVDAETLGASSTVDYASDPAVRRAFERLRSAPALDLEWSAGALGTPRPVVRGREIVLEESLVGGLRFAGHVDLLQLARMACRHRHVPDLFEEYCQACAPVPLPSVVGGLSVLVAKGILHERN